ncbi:transposase [Pseudomonas syringae]|uniref:Transposase n=1 Tax=Pseudomonas syringae CC1417 TaxID=1357272 RepID=A0AAU8LNM4_PSESX
MGQIYLVTSVVRKREPVFNDLLMGRLLVRELRRCEEQKLAKTLAWVVMPDHFHWLFELQDKSLSGVVQQLKARSSIAVGKLKPEQTPLWQPGYHDKAIRKEQDLIGVARYVVANPIRAGLVTKLGDYSLWDAIWI